MPLALGENFNPSIGPFLAIMVLGFLIAVGGHITKTSWVVLLGLFLIFLATVLLPLLVLGTGST